MISDDIRLAHKLHEFVGKQYLLEQGTVSLSICTFRFVPADLRERARGEAPVTDYLNELNARIATALRLSGRAFVSNAHKNCTWTILALAWRTADYITQQRKQGAL